MQTVNKRQRVNVIDDYAHHLHNLAQLQQRHDDGDEGKHHPHAEPVLVPSSATLPTASPTLPTASPTLPTASPTLPTASPTLPTASPTLPTASPALPNMLDNLFPPNDDDAFDDELDHEPTQFDERHSALDDHHRDHRNHRLDDELLGRVNAIVVQRRRGRHLLRSVVVAILFVGHLRSRVNARRQSHMAEFADVVDLYLEVARAWMRSSLVVPIGSIVSPSSTMDLTTSPSSTTFLHRVSTIFSSSSSSSPSMQILVRVRYIADRLVELASSITTIPAGLLGFVNRYLVGNRAFPDDYLLGTERRLLQAASSSALSLSSMMMMNFFVGRAMVGMMVRPWDYQIGRRPDTTTMSGRLALANIRIMASVVYQTTIGDDDGDDTEDDQKLRAEYGLLSVDDDILKEAKAAIDDGRRRMKTFVELMMMRAHEQQGSAGAS